MSTTFELPADLKARVDALALRRQLSPSDIIADALLHGRSLEWQERYIEHISLGLADADQGRFGTDDELARVVDKYRPA